MFVDHPRRAEVDAAILHHLGTVGPKHWKTVFAQFPDIVEGTIWRWIKELRVTAPPKPRLHEAQVKIKKKLKGVTIDRAVEAEEDGTTEIAQHLPAAPRPEYIAKAGARGMENIDVVVEIRKLYTDAEMLRAYAMTTRTNADGDTVESIKNPLMFDKSIARRAGLLDSTIRALQEVWDLRTMQNFYETIIDEIGKESPETQRRIMERLADLNARSGMTMAMRV